MRALCVALALGGAAMSLSAEETGGTLASTPAALDAAAALGESRAVVGRRLGEHVLRDVAGAPVRLSSYRGKPLLVSFVYTGCFQVCPAGTRALRQAVRGLEKRFGPSQFAVASIGFNQPADSPAAMKAFAAQHGVDLPHWAFLSPAADDVDALTRELGFSFRATPAGFDHLLQVTLVDADGRIVRQIYGAEIGADAIGEPLTLLLAHKPLPLTSGIADLIGRVRILCTVYDPASDSYRVDYSLALEVAGGLTFAVAVLLYLLNDLRARRAAARRGQGATRPEAPR